MYLKKYSYFAMANGFYLDIRNFMSYEIIFSSFYFSNKVKIFRSKRSSKSSPAIFQSRKWFAFAGRTRSKWQVFFCSYRKYFWLIPQVIFAQLLFSNNLSFALLPLQNIKLCYSTKWRNVSKQQKQ